MKIPDKIKIGGHVYKVVFPYTFIERHDIDGLTDQDTLEIKLSAGDGTGQKLARSKIEEHFFHEIIHAIDDVYNANGLDEPMVKRLGQGLYRMTGRFGRQE